MPAEVRVRSFSFAFYPGTRDISAGQGLWIDRAKFDCACPTIKPSGRHAVARGVNRPMVRDHDCSGDDHRADDDPQPERSSGFQYFGERVPTAPVYGFTFKRHMAALQN